jgi:predicted DNA-binding transcriptional regulator YafY
VSSRALTALAAACHDGLRVAFDYRGHAGEASRRAVEPHRLVHTRPKMADRFARAAAAFREGRHPG